MALGRVQSRRLTPSGMAASDQDEPQKFLEESPLACVRFRLSRRPGRRSHPATRGPAKR